MKKNNLTRRTFLKSSAMAGALGVMGTTSSAGLFTSCSGDGKSKNGNVPLKEPGSYYIPELPDKAADENDRA